MTHYPKKKYPSEGDVSFDDRIRKWIGNGYQPCEIGSSMGIPLEFVYQRLESLGIPFPVKPLKRRSMEIRRMTADIITDCGTSMTYREIGMKYGIHPTQIANMARKAGIHRRVPVPLDDNLIIEKYVKDLWSAKRISEDLGYNVRRVTERLRELGILRSRIETVGARSDRRLRNQGTQFPLDGKGYAIIKLPEGHKTARPKCGGMVCLHVYEMEKKLGRPIKPNEIIHHIDFDKMNSDIENLFLCETRPEHSMIHSTLNKACNILFRKRVLGFNGRKYFVRENVLKKLLASGEPSEEIVSDGLESLVAK